jgi:hypothetical protein
MKTPASEEEEAEDMSKDPRAAVPEEVAEIVEEVVRRAETDLLSAFLVNDKPAIEEPSIGVKAQLVVEEATRAILSNPAMGDAIQLAVDSAGSPDPSVRSFAQDAVRDVSTSLVENALNAAMDRVLGKPA